MSLTTKQIDELRAYAADRKGELAKLITDAADTIEMLSAKLHASQMERSSQYYHGGWIPCSERLPEDDKTKIVTLANGNAECGYYSNGDWWCIGDSINLENPIVISWMPLPLAYREEGEKR